VVKVRYEFDGDESLHIQSLQDLPCEIEFSLPTVRYRPALVTGIFVAVEVLNRFPLESPSCLFLLITKSLKLLYVLRFLGRMYTEG